MGGDVCCDSYVGAGGDDGADSGEAEPGSTACDEDGLVGQVEGLSQGCTWGGGRGHGE